MAPQPGGHDEAKSEGLAMTPELAEYIADLLAELRDIAHATGTSNLENILEIARREAADPMVQRQRTGQD